jgi:hypothetical protein
MSTTTLPLRLPRRLSALAAALLPLALAGAAGADTVLVLKAHQDATVVAGQEQPARDGTVELWIGDGRASRSDDLGRFVLLPDEVVIVNHADRTYTALELPVDFRKLMPPGMQQSAEMWKLEAKVTPGEERRKIGDWNTRRYTIELTNAMGLAVRTEMWTTTELGFDLEVYHRLARQMLALQPGTAELLAEMAKVEGFPVLQETSVDAGGSTVTTREELVSVETKEPPPDAYGAPEGYERNDPPAAAPAPPA